MFTKSFIDYNNLVRKLGLLDLEFGIKKKWQLKKVAI